MKAAVRDRYGSPDVVALTEVDRPVPSVGQVLVRVRAASVNRADLDGLKPRPGLARLFMKELIAAGKLAPVIDRQYPLTGVVEALRHVDDGRARGKVVISI